jgi:hypothetical protein
MNIARGTALLVLLIGSAHADEWGTISGQIVVEGDVPDPVLLFAKDDAIKDKEVCAAKDHYAEDLIVDPQTKGLANVFIYLAEKRKLIHPDLVKPKDPEVVVTYRDCQYDPHCMIVRTNQTIVIASDDAVAHNPHIHPQKNQQIAGLIAPRHPRGTSFQLRTAETLPIKVTCDFHPWMMGHWLVVDHPYAALTDKDGRFKIEHLPVGEHKFLIWHERTGTLEKDFKITVTAGEPVELPVMKIDINRLKKPDPVK